MSFVDEYAAVEQRFHAMRREVDAALSSVGITYLTADQAMILIRLGAREMTVGALAALGCSAGSKFSYHIGPLLERGFLEARPAPRDRRTKLVRLTAPAVGIVQSLTDLLENDVQDAPQSNGAVRPDGGHLKRISFHVPNVTAAE